MYPTQMTIAIESRGILIKWSPPEYVGDILGYFVDMADSEAGPYTQLNAEPLLKTQFITEELPVGRTYYFRIRLVDVNGNWSETTPVVGYLQ